MLLFFWSLFIVLHQQSQVDFLILPPFPHSLSISSPFPLHFLILSSFPRSPAARLQQFVQPCYNRSLIMFNLVVFKIYLINKFQISVFVIWWERAKNLPNCIGLVKLNQVSPNLIYLCHFYLFDFFCTKLVLFFNKIFLEESYCAKCEICNNH